jgi:3-(methylthio)propionyl---CoA ligase
VVEIADPEPPRRAKRSAPSSEAFLADGGDAEASARMPADERKSIALSCTAGDPKGVVTHHRCANLDALAFGLGPESVCLWPLPMFHCNGWTCLGRKFAGSK